MAIISYRSSDMAVEGDILTGALERKPEGFPEDDGLLRGYSNILLVTYSE